MKKLFTILLAICLLCGCSSEKPVEDPFKGVSPYYAEWVFFYTDSFEQTNFYGAGSANINESKFYYTPEKFKVEFYQGTNKTTTLTGTITGETTKEDQVTCEATLDDSEREVKLYYYVENEEKADFQLFIHSDTGWACLFFSPEKQDDVFLAKTKVTMKSDGSLVDEDPTNVVPFTESEVYAVIKDSFETNMRTEDMTPSIEYDSQNQVLYCFIDCSTKDMKKLLLSKNAEVEQSWNSVTETLRVLNKTYKDGLDVAGYVNITVMMIFRDTNEESMLAIKNDTITYDVTKQSTSSTSGSKSSSSSSSFSNKYGSRTTKCHHSDCNNYIASSGDTWDCATHAHRCGNCKKYIDCDAMYCMDCLSNALK